MHFSRCVSPDHLPTLDLSTMSGPRIAIIGAGMSGSVCAWALRRAGLSVTVFEMGRGGGGRMATRKSRNLEGFAANHGCPAFTASQPWFKSMVQQLMDEHVVRVWSGRFGAYDAGTQTATEDPAPQVMYVGSPGMSSICDKLLSDAERCFETQVTSFERKAERWVLTDKNAKEVGTFDWLVISSHSLAHPRWTQIFKTPPPLQTAAATLGVCAPSARWGWGRRHTYCTSPYRGQGSRALAGLSKRRCPSRQRRVQTRPPIQWEGGTKTEDTRTMGGARARTDWFATIWVQFVPPTWSMCQRAKVPQQDADLRLSSWIPSLGFGFGIFEITHPVVKLQLCTIEACSYPPSPLRKHCLV